MKCIPPEGRLLLLTTKPFEPFYSADILPHGYSTDTMGNSYNGNTIKKGTVLGTVWGWNPVG